MVTLPYLHDRGIRRAGPGKVNGTVRLGVQNPGAGYELAVERCRSAAGIAMKLGSGFTAAEGWEIVCIPVLHFSRPQPGECRAESRDLLIHRFASRFQ